jgi:hypothetical protein
MVLSMRKSGVWLNCPTNPMFRIRSMRSFSFMSIALALTCLGACWGCGSSEGARAALLPVKGKVTYKGMPLTQGIVKFEPEGYGRRASGKLQSDGSFVLGTFKDDDGAVKGSHQVFITDVDNKLAKDRAFQKYMFRSPNGLSAEVTPESLEFTFDLR